MSDDLISRKALLKTLSSCNFGNASVVRDSDGFPTHISIVGIIKIISNQPTAFDKEKVIEKLNWLQVNSFGYYNQYDDEQAFGESSAFRVAIEVVEKGGIE